MVDLDELRTDVINILEAAGFSVRRDELMHGYKVDVVAEKDLVAVQKDFKIICAFVHEQSELTLRERVKEFRELNKELKADKCIIVLVGLEAYGEDRGMAKRQNILIWEKDNIKNYLKCFSEKDKDACNRLMSDLGLESYTDPNLDYSSSFYCG
ncbi:hypothetical protein GOV09_01880 [Candidatus Woesearchaeota archaeon]|nr:hypothetical protein [Candidatus Woesearchaeota archaeon]